MLSSLCCPTSNARVFALGLTATLHSQDERATKV